MGSSTIGAQGILMAYDVPEHHIPPLLKVVYTDGFPQLSPRKSLMAGAAAGIAATRDILSEGGGRSSSFVPSASSNTTRPNKQNIQGRKRKVCDMNSLNVREAKRRKPGDDKSVRDDETLQKEDFSTNLNGPGASNFKDEKRRFFSHPY
jgi:hypothetical protein